MARLLVTGFECFPGVPVNISEQLVRGWRQRPPAWPFGELRFEVLPTCYEAAGAAICALLSDYAPDCCLLLGVAGTPSTLRLERFALNIDDAAIADASGDFRRGTPIARGGALALATPVDIGRLQRTLVAAGVDAEVSNHAGSYVCNHTYYAALSAVKRLEKRTPVLFVHIPSGSPGNDAVAQQARASLVNTVAAGAEILVTEWFRDIQSAQ